MKYFTKLVLSIAVVLLSSVFTYAQLQSSDQGVLVPADIEGYVMDGNGNPISGATVGVLDGISTLSDASGYYFFSPDVGGAGNVGLYAWRSDYNYEIYPSVWVNPGSVTYQDIILRAPTMIISPTSHDYTLNPGENFTTQTGILNNGDDDLYWSAEVVYPTTDGGGNRSMFDCGAASVFGNVPSGFTNAYLSEEGGANQEYQEISGITGNWNTVSFWGIFAEAIPSGLHSFVIEIYESGASPGNLLTSFSADIVPIPTAEFMQGYPIYYFQTNIDEQTLSDCWIKIASTDLSETFSWLNSPSGSGDAQTWQGSSQLGSHEALAICLESKIVDGWCTLDWYASIVPPFGGLENLPTNFDATQMSAGEVLNCDIVFTSHPDYGTYTIPVEMTVDGEALIAPTNFQLELIDSVNGYVHGSWDWLTESFQFFVVYVDGTPFGTSTSQSFIWHLSDHGEHCFSVRAFYDEGFSAEVGDCIDWLAPEVFIDPDFHEAWVWVDGTYQWTTTIHNLGPGLLYYEFPSPATGYIVDVSPVSGTIPDGGSDQITISWDAIGFPPGDYFEDLHCETNDTANPDVYIENLMHVYTPAYFGGIVTDAITNLPINGATITAGVWQTQSIYDGSYLLAVDEGTYVLYCDKLGYESVFVIDTMLVAGDTTIIDMELMPLSYPVPWVTSTVAYCNEPTTTLLEWSHPEGPAEIIYDDGTAEDLFVWALADGECAVRFTPSGYPAKVFGASVYVGDGQWPSGNWMGSEFAVLVYDDDGAAGLPGSIIDSTSVVVNNYGWIVFYIYPAISFDSGDFYLSMKQLSNSPAAPIGIDTDTPVDNRSYSKSPGGNWGLATTPDYMIRAYVDGPTATPISHYNIIRLHDFDPNVGPQTGIVTDLGSSNTLSFTDTDFQFLPEAWYGHAVQTVYASGDSSNWVYSNITGNDMGKIVDITTVDCLGNILDSVDIMLYGEDWPYYVFSTDTSMNGSNFDCVWAGIYSIEVYKPGFEPLTLDYIPIFHDTSFVFTIDPILYAPNMLRVDSISSIAIWDEPLVTALIEDFEGALMPPNGWQMSTNSVGWFLTTNGSSVNWEIPVWNSQYACANDDDAGSMADGSVDYLITPPLDFRESEAFHLQFDSYFDTLGGQLAYVEYSFDAGNSWEVLDTLAGVSASWDYLDIDLSDFSGMNSAYPVWFAFHADDNGGWASGWAIDNVLIASGSSNPIDYFVYLDNSFVAITDTTFYQYMELTYGQVYMASVCANYQCGSSEQIYVDFTSGYLRAPAWLEGDSLGHDVVLNWWMDTSSISSNILGYHLYRDSTNIAFIAFTGEDTSYYTDEELEPLCYEYHVSTIYDLSGYGFPGDTGESLYTGPDEVCLAYGTTLPYSQNWDSGSFEPFWTAGENWLINGQVGNPEPSAEFTWAPMLNNYQESIVSGPFNGIDQGTKSDPYLDGQFILSFDVKLDDMKASGTEYFFAEVWSNGVWYKVAEFSNANGSFDWEEVKLDITEYAMGNIFKIRFMAEGELSSEILSWFVDNIEIYHYCAIPENFFVDGIDITELVLGWSTPIIRSSNNLSFMGENLAPQTATSPKDCSGYNVYMDYEGSGYEFIAFTEDTTYTYHPEYLGFYCFYVTAVYESCESQASNEDCIMIPPWGLGENDENDFIRIYPNPSNDLINIETAYGITHLCLLDYSGRMLQCHELPNEMNYTMDVSSYEQGVYLLRIDTERGRAVRKVVVTE